MKRTNSTLKTKNLVVIFSTGEKFRTIGYFIEKKKSLPKEFIKFKGTFYYTLGEA
jgi:hypothetical protein